MVDPAIINGVEKYLNHLIRDGMDVRFGIIFGSRTTDQTHIWSDIDVLVVSPLFDDSIQRKHIDTLWHIAARTDNRIEPIPCGQQQWLNNTSDAVIDVARKHGIKVTPHGN